LGKNNPSADLKYIMKNPLIIHPFLFSMFGVLVPIVANIHGVGYAGIQSLIVAQLVTFLLIIFSRIIFKEQQKSALIVTGFIILFFSYGHVSNLLVKWGVGVRSFPIDGLLLPLWFGMVLIWVVFIVRKLSDLNLATNYFNVTGGLLVIISVANLLYTTSFRSPGINELAYYQEMTWQHNRLIDKPLSAPTGGNAPQADIYWIILDSYSRQDTLLQYYDFDNSSFLNELQGRGFYIADQARSNYWSSTLSIASSLNMSHLTHLPDLIAEKHKSHRYEAFVDTVAHLIPNSLVLSFLRQYGYQIVAFDNGYAETTLHSADILLSDPELPAQGSHRTSIDMLLLNTTLGKAILSYFIDDFIPLQAEFDIHRQRILFMLDELPEIAEREGNYFVLAHILSPHPPYVFGPNGEVRMGVDPFTLLDDYSPDRYDPSLYTDQITYLNNRVLSIIDQIIEKSDTPPIIILQADHGPRSAEGNLNVIFSILSAYYLPGIDKPTLYPSISPVNTFRVVFNSYFGTSLGLIDDTSYKLDRSGGTVEFRDICAVHDICSASSYISE
jgi:hypothetical protein